MIYCNWSCFMKLVLTIIGFRISEFQNFRWNTKAKHIYVSKITLRVLILYFVFIFLRREFYQNVELLFYFRLLIVYSKGHILILTDRVLFSVLHVHVHCMLYDFIYNDVFPIVQVVFFHSSFNIVFTHFFSWFIWFHPCESW